MDSGRRLKMRASLATCVAAWTLVLMLAMKETQALQYSHPAFMLIWRSEQQTKKRTTTPDVVDLSLMTHPILSSSAVQSELHHAHEKKNVLDNVDPSDSNYEWLQGVGPYGFIEITGATTSFNRPLFDYDTLINAVYQANYQKWANQTGGWDTYDLWERRNMEMGARRKRMTDANGFEENWMGRTGVSPFKVTKQVDKVSPVLFKSAFGTNQIGPTPDLFEVLIFFRLEDSARSPYTVIRLHHAVLSEYQLVTDASLVESDESVMEEELWFEYARMDYAYAESIQDGCSSSGCPPSPSSVLNCRLGILYDFPYDPVFPGCPS